MTNGQVIEALVKTNDPLYNLRKANEECNELALVLIQKINKLGGAKEPTNEDVIEEIGDVEIRLQILKAMFGEQQVNDRIQLKLDKYKKYIENGQYVGKI